MADENDDIRSIIAHAIKGADKRYFLENYGTQADAVIAALRETGWLLVPREPTEPMLEAGSEAMAYGRVNKANVVRSIYLAMVRQNPRRERSPLKAIAKRMRGPTS